MTEIVLDTAQAGATEIRSRLVRPASLEKELPAERPAIVLAYAPGSHMEKQAQQARFQLLRSLEEGQGRLPSAKTLERLGIRLVIADHEWRAQLGTLLLDLGDTVLCVMNRDVAPVGRSGKPNSGKPKRTAQSEARASAIGLAHARRERILATGKWYSAAEVAKLLNGKAAASNPSQFASQLRRQKRLLGVRNQGAFLHPEFQFSVETGLLHERLRELLAILPGDSTGWGAAFWCFQPTRRLGKKSPADVFVSDPDSVIAAAKQDFEGDDAGW